MSGASEDPEDIKEAAETKAAKEDENAKHIKQKPSESKDDNKMDEAEEEDNLLQKAKLKSPRHLERMMMKKKRRTRKLSLKPIDLIKTTTANWIWWCMGW